MYDVPVALVLFLTFIVKPVDETEATDKVYLTDEETSERIGVWLKRPTGNVMSIVSEDPFPSVLELVPEPADILKGTPRAPAVALASTSVRRSAI